MSFDPSSYSNSDLITNSHSGQSDMPFNPSSYSNYNLMTSYHAQPNAPFNPTSYDNSNLMMSSIGSYSDMAQVKHVPYDPFEYQRRTAQYNSNALAWDEVREPDEPFGRPTPKTHSKPISQKEYVHNYLNNLNNPSNAQPQNTLREDTVGRNSISYTKNTHIFEQNNQLRSNNMGISNTHQEHMLSAKDRENVKRINNDNLTALMKRGDRAAERGDFRNEMLDHRSVQETMSLPKSKGGEYQLEYRHSDPESKKAFGYNSCMIHFKPYAEYYFLRGYKFDEIFEQNPKGPIGDYQCIKGEEYKKDPKAVDYLNQSRAKDTRNQLDINNNAKSKPTRRGKRGGRKHKKSIHKYGY